jgi:[ribosomal protein S18]-alanine N-acetyltransferase
MDPKCSANDPHCSNGATTVREPVQFTPSNQEPLVPPQLRPFRTSDLEDAYQLDQACFAPGIAYSRAQLGAYVRMRNANSWVAEVAEGGDSRLAGFVIANRDRRAQGHIVTVDVAPAWRRHGVGTLLMDAAETWLREQGGEVVYLETAVENSAAQAFYLRRGYAKLRRIEDYYASGAAAWLMAKEIMNDER